MTDQVIAGRQAPTSGAPPDQLAGAATTLLETYLAHPWLVETGQRTMSPGPRTLGWFEFVLGILTPAHQTSTAMSAAVSGLARRFARPPVPVDWSAISDRTPLLAAALSTASPGRADPGLFERTVRGVANGLLSR